MGIAERKERRKAELREQILVAARRIVLEDGFDELSMRKIADAIEYSPATIYLHFASRDEIAMQLVREGFTELLAYFADVLTVTDPYDRLFAIGRRYLQFGLDRPETYRLIFMEDPKFSSVIMDRTKLENPAEPGGQAFLALRTTLCQLIDAKRLKPVDPDVAADVVWAAMHGLVSLQVSCPDMRFDDLDGHLDLLMTSLMYGMAA